VVRHAQCQTNQALQAAPCTTPMAAGISGTSVNSMAYTAGRSASTYESTIIAFCHQRPLEFPDRPRLALQRHTDPPNCPVASFGVIPDRSQWLAFPGTDAVIIRALLTGALITQ
jgi:hypothetical protein